MSSRQLTIGREDKHQLTLSRQWFLSLITVRIDGEKVKTLVPLTGGTKRIECKVGGTEPHDILIVVKLPITFAFIRKWEYEVWLDGAKIEEGVLTRFGWFE